MNSTIQPTIMLTVDVEDWFQVENLRPWFPPETWSRQELRVENNTNDLLDILDSIPLASPGCPATAVTPKATFFVLGWVAQKLPGLVREIQSRGHEVASHGHGHMLCSQLDPVALEKDLIRSKKTIEDIIGDEVRGYRAPNFSTSDLALALVHKCSYRYDSSYNDFARHGRYGTISAKRISQADTVIKIANGFFELPISNLNLGKHVLPWGGGGYFRFFPPALFRAGIRRILQRSQAYVFYMHPWEIDPGQPRIKEARGLSGWRHYLNLDDTRDRLRKMISAFGHCNFTTCSNYLSGITMDTQKWH